MTIILLLNRKKVLTRRVIVRLTLSSISISSMNVINSSTLLEDEGLNVELDGDGSVDELDVLEDEHDVLEDELDDDIM